MIETYTRIKPVESPIDKVVATGVDPNFIPSRRSSAFRNLRLEIERNKRKIAEETKLETIEPEVSDHVYPKEVSDGIPSLLPLDDI